MRALSDTEFITFGKRLVPRKGKILVIRKYDQRPPTIGKTKSEAQGGDTCEENVSGELVDVFEDKGYLQKATLGIGEYREEVFVLSPSGISYFFGKHRRNEYNWKRDPLVFARYSL